MVTTLPRPTPDGTQSRANSAAPVASCTYNTRRTASTWVTITESEAGSGRAASSRESERSSATVFTGLADDVPFAWRDATSRAASDVGWAASPGNADRVASLKDPKDSKDQTVVANGTLAARLVAAMKATQRPDKWTMC
jgi:hypothetical protein